MVTPREGRRLRQAAPRRGSHANPEHGAATLRFDVAAVRARASSSGSRRRSERGRSRAGAPNERGRGADPGCALPRSSSTSRGRSATCPSASGRSTSTGCIRTSASSSRSSSRRCSTATSPARHVLDPFAGSGTTLVQSLESGYDATGVDIAAFNCLLMRVKTRRYNPFVARARAARRRGATRARRATDAPARYMRDWFAPQAATRAARVPRARRRLRARDVLRVMLARAARSARRTTHFDLDFPRKPQLEQYWCHKHKRECRPVERARARFCAATRSTRSSGSRRSRACAREAREAHVLHGDARELDFGGPFDGVVTSPPYPGLIDYHEQHRYAYELLGLDDCASSSSAPRPRARAGQRSARTCEGVAGVLARAAVAAPGCARGDRRQRPARALPEILERAGLRLEATAPPPREPPHRAARRRVLRGRARRPQNRLEISARPARLPLSQVAVSRAFA